VWICQILYLCRVTLFFSCNLSKLGYQYTRLLRDIQLYQVDVFGVDVAGRCCSSGCGRNEVEEDDWTTDEQGNTRCAGLSFTPFCPHFSYM
jgi:hypothetical protein